MTGSDATAGDSKLARYGLLRHTGRWAELIESTAAGCVVLAQYEQWGF